MKKILVIEDNQEILENTAELLELSNYKVYTAANGWQGVELALEHKPDLILCDIMMPELDGYGVLHMVHLNPELQSLPFIFLTAKAEQSDIRKGMSLGADDYILKPFDPTDLLNALEGRLKKAELFKEKIAGETETGSKQQMKAEQALNGLVETGYVDIYKKKQRIFSEGNHPVRMYYVQKGKVKLFKMNDDGKEIIVKIVNEGMFFGHPAIFAETVYQASAETLEDSEIVSVSKTEFEQLLRSNPPILEKFIKILADDIVQRDEQLLQIAYNSLRRKVADALMVVHKAYNTDSGKPGIYLSRETLAAIAGTATESLIRTLSDFKSEKLIDIKDGAITLLNEEALKRMIN